MWKKIQPEWIAVSVLLISFFGVFITVSLHRYWQYSVWYYDFGIFYSAIAAVAQLKPPIIDHFIFTDKNILGDHFHPLIFLLSPAVALFNTGETLLVAQTLFVTLSGLFVYLTAKELLKNRVESLAILVIYLSFIGLHNALITEFHELALLPLPLTIFFYGMVKKKLGWYVAGLIGVLLTKETTFVIPAWFGLVILIKNSGQWRKIGLATVAASLAYGGAVMAWVIPAFSGQDYYYLRDVLKDSQTESLLNPLKISTVGKTLASYGFLPLFAPELLPPVLFNWWSRFSGVSTTRHDLGLHYNAEIAPTLILASTYGWLRLKIYIIGNFNQISRPLLSGSLIVIAGATCFYSVWILKSPALLFINPAFYSHSQNFSFLDQLIAAIPQDGVVMAQTNIAAKIAHRKVYMLRNNYQDFNPDYIVIDQRDGQEPNNFLGIKDFSSLISDLESDPNYQVIYDGGEQKIYRLVN